MLVFCMTIWPLWQLKCLTLIPSCHARRARCTSVSLSWGKRASGRPAGCPSSWTPCAPSPTGTTSWRRCSGWAADFAQERRWKEAAAKKVQRLDCSCLCQVPLRLVKCSVLVKTQFPLMCACTSPACANLCPSPQRAEDVSREIQEGGRNAPPLHRQHRRPRGGVLLVQHRTGILLTRF